MKNLFKKQMKNFVINIYIRNKIFSTKKKTYLISKNFI